MTALRTESDRCTLNVGLPIQTKLTNYIQRMEIDMSNKKIKNPLWDNELNIEKRLDFLINSLTLDEKISCMSNANPDIDRLGIRAFNIGGEGAHGVQA